MNQNEGRKRGKGKPRNGREKGRINKEMKGGKEQGTQTGWQGRNGKLAIWYLVQERNVYRREGTSYGGMDKQGGQGKKKKEV